MTLTGTGRVTFVERSLNELDLFRAVIGSGNLPGQLDDRTRLDREHAAGPELAGENRQNAGARADIQHHRARPNRRAKCPGIGLDANTIGNHLSVSGEAVKIGDHFRGSIAGEESVYTAPESGNRNRAISI